MQRRKKISSLLTVLSILAFLLILAVGILMAKKYWMQDYQDQVDGFSMKYPAGWTKEEDQNGTAVIFFSPLENDLDFFKDNVNIVVQNLGTNPKSLVQYTELAVRQLQVVFENNIEIIESVDLYWGNLPAHKLIFVGRGKDGTELKYMNVWTLTDTKAYQFTYTANAISFDKHLPFVEKMLKSFRLLK